MSTNNPFRKHASSMFGTRGCDVDEAIVYANDVITAMPTDVQAHAMTALMVVINTAANAFDQARGPSPERLALIELIDQRINEHKLVREDEVDSKVQDWMDNNLDMDDVISEWMGNNFDITDHDDNIDWDTQLHDRLNDWMTDNLESKINDLDLVVRIR